MEIIMGIIAFAFLIEAVIEVLKPLIHRLDGLGDKLGVEFGYMLSLVMAVAGAIAFRLDAISLFGIENAGIVGQILSGLLASGGSNFVHNKLRHVTELPGGTGIDPEAPTDTTE